MIMSGGTMTRDQLAAHVRDFFGKLDANHDGYLTRDEMGAMGQHAMMIHQGAGMADGMGKHMDGMAMPDRGAMFDRLDVNHDGSVSRQEFMAAKPQIRTERIVLKREGGPESAAAPGMPGMKMRMHGGMGMGGHLFEMADANHDGRVSLSEAETAVLAHFDKADLNHDGKISPDERTQARQFRLQRRAG
jgi:Ca2+-binding EF-hand superfamily protein